MIRLDALGALDGLFFWTVEGLLPKPPHWLCFWMIASHAHWVSEGAERSVPTLPLNKFMDVQIPNSCEDCEDIWATTRDMHRVSYRIDHAGLERSGNLSLSPKRPAGHKFVAGQTIARQLFR